jgi:hypothetical protein
MTITGSMIRLTPLGEFKGIESVNFATAVDFDSDEAGDWEFPPDTRRTLTLNVTFCTPRPALLYAITGSRRVFGWPRKLAVNGHEYNRRRRKH